MPGAPDRSDGAILLYHSVGAQGVPLARFSKHMRHVTRQFDVCRLEEVASPPTAQRRASVTFDDGRLDDYQAALSVLEPLGIKASFYLIPPMLGKKLSTSLGDVQLMSVGQARELSALGHDMGAHTMSHIYLTRVPPAEARREISDSKRALEDILGTAVTSFAYPHGAHNEDVRTLTIEAGYERAVTTKPALVRNSSDTFALPRIDIGRYDGMLEFRAKLSPGIEVYERLVRRSK